jgi:hypothetical protein
MRAPTKSPPRSAKLKARFTGQFLNPSNDATRRTLNGGKTASGVMTRQGVFGIHSPSKVAREFDAVLSEMVLNSHRGSPCLSSRRSISQQGQGAAALAVFCTLFCRSKKRCARRSVSDKEVKAGADV